MPLQGQGLQDMILSPQTEHRPLCHIWPREMHFNEKQKVSLAQFGLSATPRVNAGHDITSMPSCSEVSTQASVPSGSAGLKGFPQRHDIVEIQSQPSGHLNMEKLAEVIMQLFFIKYIQSDRDLQMPVATNGFLLLH